MGGRRTEAPRTCVCTHMHIYVCMYTYVHTYIHTYTVDLLIKFAGRTKEEKNFWDGSI